jgi:hypothetical protein
MKVFDLKDNEVVISPEILTIEIFAEIWKEDKSKTKINACTDFKFIYHLCDFNSPYNNYSEEKRTEAIKEEVLGKKDYEPSDKVKQACEIYKRLKQSPLEVLLNSVKNKIFEFSKYLDENEVDAESTTASLKIIDSMSKVVSQYKSLESAVKAEKQDTAVKIRGDKQVNSEFNE